jgi:CBS domain-containing protein
MRNHLATKTRAGRASAFDPTGILAREVMHTDVLVLRVDDPIRWAAEQLEEAGVTGAPVVDAAGRLLGVLTVSDIARSEHVANGGITTRMEESAGARVIIAESEVTDEEVFATDDYGDAVLGRARVADWMTTGVKTVAPDVSLAEVCRAMSDGDIHRVFVVKGNRLQGVISTTDVVRLLAAPAHRSRLQ